MKTTITISIAELHRHNLLPNELAVAISIASRGDEKTGFWAANRKYIGISVKSMNEAIESLIAKNIIIKKGRKYRLKNKKMLKANTSPGSKSKSRVDGALMSSINADQVPDHLKEYFVFARAFQNVFYHNLKSQGIRTINVEKATFKKWVDPIRLMMEEDDISKKDLTAVGKFLKENEFWKANCQSTMKLREKFQTIHTQAKSNVKGNSKKADNGNISSDYVQKVMRDIQGE